MKLVITMMIGVLFLAGCAQWFVEPFPGLVETEEQRVAGCEMLGVVVETADAANPFPLAAEGNMALRVRERAGYLGATHIVWLHRTPSSAAAETYRCPQP